MLPVIRNQPQTLLRVFPLLLLSLILPTKASSQTIAIDYGVRPGDKVTVLLYTGGGVEVREVGGERIIDRAGEIFLPYVGPTAVAGLDQAGIRGILTERYSTF
jgi:protein involved in polysaccharide export with SLBB domain